MFVAIDPTRVLDTRIDAGLSGPLVNSTARKLDVTGTIPIVLPGDVLSTGSPVPDGATAIVANVTGITPSTIGFLAIRPGTATGSPASSNVNFTAPGVIVPNSVTVELPTVGAAAGTIDLYFFGTASGATLDVAIDIVGYYQAGGAGIPGPKGDTGATGPKGDTGATGPAGLSYVTSQDFGLTEPVGTSNPPPAPSIYKVTSDLAVGRYLLTGNITIKNVDETNEGIVSCRTFVGNSPVGTYAIDSLSPANLNRSFTNLPVSATFTIDTAATTSVSYRCFRNGNSTQMEYWFGALQLFKVG